MYYLLYNPKSNAGKTAIDILKLEKKLNKKGIKTFKYDLFDLNAPEALRRNVKEDDVIVIAGGDGTISRLVNNELFTSLNNKIYLYTAGRGNDFSREFKGRFFEITNHIKNLPKLHYEDYSQYFINGIGVGIDAATCNIQMNNFYQSKKESYFKIALRTFKTFKPYTLDVCVDGKDYHFDKVWFFVVQNGKYFGGGMKISPKSIREDDYLELVVVNNCKLSKLIPIFPLIFIGKHTIAKKCVTLIKGKEFNIKVDGCNILQADGEILNIPNEINVSR